MAKFRAYGAFKLSDVDLNEAERLPHVYSSKLVPAEPGSNDAELVLFTIEAYQRGNSVVFGMVGPELVLNEKPPSTGRATEFGMSFAPATGEVTEWGILDTSVSARALMKAVKSASTADDLQIIQKALSGNDKIILSNFKDEMNGFGGNDYLKGRGGVDILGGGDGKDSLEGGSGRDTLTGGADADKFVFLAVSDSGVGAQSDIISDFTGGSDLIDLQRIDADTALAGNQAFNFIGGSGFSGQACELRFEAGKLSGDVTGDGQADFEITVSGVKTMTASDFIL